MYTHAHYVCLYIHIHAHAHTHTHTHTFWDYDSGACAAADFRRPLPVEPCKLQQRLFVRCLMLKLYYMVYCVCFSFSLLFSYCLYCLF